MKGRLLRSNTSLLRRIVRAKDSFWDAGHLRGGFLGSSIGSSRHIWHVFLSMQQNVSGLLLMDDG